MKKADDKKAPKFQVVEVNPRVLVEIDQADRSEWDYETYVTVGQDISKVKSYSQWLTGKLASEVNKKFGDITQFARDIRQNRGSVYTYKHVYEKLTKEDPSFVPDGYVPYGILMMAAKEDKPLKLLEEMANKSITTIPEADRHIKTMKSGKTIPAKPKMQLKWDEEKEVWKIIIAPEDIPKIDWSDVREQLVDYLIADKS